MKVKIGPYPNWWGPYQIAEAICFWAKPVTDEYGIKSKPDWVHDFGTWLAEDRDGSDSWITKTCQWIHDRRKRRVYVHIDRYDVWGADHTLSLIALPLLEKLRDTKHGSPHVDDSDVPAGMGLRSTEAPAKANDWDTDDNWHDRWAWVLDEMIWAHRQEALGDPDSEACWQHDVPDVNWPYPNTATGIERMIGNITCDEVALAKLMARKQNGFRLFGKYYQALWD
jgi:hypothetical protein